MPVKDYFYFGAIENCDLVETCGNYLKACRDKEIEIISSPDGKENSMYKVSGAAHFVRLMRESMVSLNLVLGEEEFFSVDQEDISDFRSEAALKEIFYVNERSWAGRLQYKQGMQSQAILYRWPAWKFEKNLFTETVPERFDSLEGLSVLKTDQKFWNLLGDDPLLDLRRPWNPNGFSKYFHLCDVDRETAIALGINVDQIKLKSGFNDEARKLINKMDPEEKANLLAELRGYKAPDASEKGRRAAKG
ncbi:hypothetical protein N9215_01430 [Akkermansiaceae bacterium]|nr:hypothetical protein [Akkermansiaceae bacterium]MDB4500307.1 hypothetical protein [Akkermansiaceae bacterium]